MASTATKTTQDPPNNLAIWNALSRTDPRHTKPFKRAGGFTGTAIKPIWIIHRLTEQFGPCGLGWGMGEPSFQVVPGDNREVLVFCTVAGWYAGDHGEPCRVYGVGGDKVVTHIKANEKYNRPERWENDDEAFKKAFTDAVNNAFKFVGVGADVHMGQFEDNKYIAAVEKEYVEREAANDPPQKVEGISKIKAALSKLMTAGNAADSREAFDALLAENREPLSKIRDANHAWWTGDGEDFEGFCKWIKRRRAELDEGIVSTMISSMKACETIAALNGWLETNDEAVAALDGAESRKFEMAYNLHLSALQQVERVSAGA